MWNNFAKVHAIMNWFMQISNELWNKNGIWGTFAVQRKYFKDCTYISIVMGFCSERRGIGREHSVNRNVLGWSRPNSYNWLTACALRFVHSSQWKSTRTSKSGDQTHATRLQSPVRPTMLLRLSQWLKFVLKRMMKIHNLSVIVTTTV